MDIKFLGGIIMEVIRIFIVSLGSIVSLFILTKIMGDRSMSQLSMFDYINSITIGSIAAEMATSLEGDFVKPLTAMIVYALISYFISYITCKSMVLRRFFEGHTILLYKNGQIFEKNLLKSKIDVDEFLGLCRLEGYFDLEDIYSVVLETNGKISVIPTASNRPVTTSDLNVSNPKQDYLLANVIIDGNVLKDNLKAIGKDEKWLENQLNKKKISNIKEVILATCDNNSNNLNVYQKYNKKVTRDIFE